MKRLIFISLVFLSVCLQGQVLKTHPIYIASKVEETEVIYETEFQAVYDAFGTKPASDTAAFMNTLVADLIAEGLWAKADRIWVTASVNIAGAYLDWLAPTTSARSISAGAGTVTFTHYEGFKGNATDGWLNTNYCNAEDTINVRRNSITVSAYAHDAVTNTSNYKALIGVRMVGEYITILCNYANIYSSTDYYGQINSSANFHQTGSHAQGLFTMVRRGAGETEAYINGSSFNTDTDASVSVPSANHMDFSLLAYNNDGTKQEFSDNQISLVYIGSALSDSEVTALNTAVEKYMDAMGKGVE